ncbi:MAG: 4Fe-4S cluster-binding domain-containing protein [Bdellovibrionales bacterium]|nr:4Fe-4S cluster-binding domain-containing protein [Bdellovibrionales bacterium]
MASEKQYQINEIFYSLQGEGVRAGTAALFLRFSGCNLSCSKESHGFDCDTEFVSGRSLSAREIINALRECSVNCEWIVITGGEPLLQLDEALTSALKEHGYKLAIETNGSIAPSGELLDSLDWITCSPKVAEHAIRLQRCDELKYVRAHGQGIPKPKLKDAPNKLISPAFSGEQLDQKNLEWCIALAKEHPDWRLSVQQHKVWRVR